MALVSLLRHGEADYQPIWERGWPGAAADLAPLSRGRAVTPDSPADTPRGLA